MATDNRTVPSLPWRLMVILQRTPVQRVHRPLPTACPMLAILLLQEERVDLVGGILVSMLGNGGATVGTNKVLSNTVTT
jgi:hypothetical protein